MAWEIELAETAVKQLAGLDKAIQRRITKYLSERLAVADDPRVLGRALRGELSEYWRYRVGDYRLVCEVQDDVLKVLVVRIAHRSKVYH